MTTPGPQEMSAFLLEAFSARLKDRAQAAGADEPSPDQVIAVARYYMLLRYWNAKVNLTALRLEELPLETTVDRLFVEAFVAGRVIDSEWSGVWVDLGTGGGSPAIPLKIVRPQLKLHMIESKSRKVAFLREAIRGTGLVGASVEETRIEDLSGRYRAGSADLITIRGVKADGMVFSASSHLLRVGGRLILFGSEAEEIPTGLFKRAGRERLPGGSWLSVLERT